MKMGLTKNTMFWFFPILIYSIFASMQKNCLCRYLNEYLYRQFWFHFIFSPELLQHSISFFLCSASNPLLFFEPFTDRYQAHQYHNSDQSNQNSKYHFIHLLLSINIYKKERIKHSHVSKSPFLSFVLTIIYKLIIQHKFRMWSVFQSFCLKVSPNWLFGLPLRRLKKNIT